jgi:hypothetical protein
MTPFMLAVQAVLDGQAAHAPRTEPSRSQGVAAAADTQVVIRSLAEQLVSEANAVLSSRGTSLSLVDEAGPGELAFSVGYRDRAARVRTRVAGHTAVGEVVLPGEPPSPPRELRSESELQALLLSLLAGSSGK